MNFRKALGMALFLALGGLYLLRFEGQRPAEQASTNGRLADSGGEKATPLFPDLRPEQIQRIAAVQASGTYAVERAGFVPATKDATAVTAPDSAPWIVQRPQGAAADGARVQKMIGVLLDAVSRNTLAAEEREQDQGVYGLVPPELVLTVEGSFGKRVLSFGKKIALTGRRYVQPENDSRIFVVEDGVFTTFALSAEDVRDHYPVDFQFDKVREFSLVRGEAAPLNFVRDDATSPWRLTGEDGGFVVDQDLIRKKLDSLLKLKVSHFVDEPGETIALYGLRIPKVSASLRLDINPEDVSKEKARDVSTTESGLVHRPDQLVIQFGEGVDAKSLENLRSAAQESSHTTPEQSADKEQEGKQQAGYYFRLAGSPYIYQTTRPIYGDFLQPAEFFRPRKPYREISPDDIARVEFLSGEGSKEAFSFVRASTEGWFLGNKAGETATGEKLPAKEEAVLAWLKAFQEFGVISYQNLAERGNPAHGFTEPAFSIFVYLKGKQAPLRIVFGKQVGDKAEQADGGAEEGSLVPRWAAISQPDGAFLPAFCGASEFESLKRQRSDFYP